jgi:hypothetical protein
MHAKRSVENLVWQGRPPERGKEGVELDRTLDLLLEFHDPFDR